MAQYKKMILAPNRLKKKKRTCVWRRRMAGRRKGGGGRSRARGVIHLQIRPWRSGLFQAASGCQELTRQSVSILPFNCTSHLIQRILRPFYRVLGGPAIWLLAGNLYTWRQVCTHSGLSLTRQYHGSIAASVPKSNGQVINLAKLKWLKLCEKNQKFH